MEETSCGEQHPVVDATLCIGCGLCERVCPELDAHTLRRNDAPEVYCCWLKDAELRRQSTSGGAAYAISAAVIRKGGHVWGAAYDEHLELRYTEANDLAGLSAIQKSKYVQSSVGDAFRRIKAELDNGDLVLFAGTGCHVKGLRSFLRKEYDNLLTIDLVCHGVPGQGVFRKYKEWLEERYGDEMDNYIPRHKRADGQEIGYYAMATFRKRGEVKLEQRENSYFIGFQHNLFLRTACHQCQANGKQRYSDFTVADFWGLGKLAPVDFPYGERTKGISMLALNSDKARRFFGEVSESLFFQRRSYEEASVSNKQYYRPAIPSPLRDCFRQEWHSSSWGQLADKYMRMSHKEMVLYGIKKFTPPNLLLYVKSLAKWIK